MFEIQQLIVRSHMAIVNNRITPHYSEWETIISGYDDLEDAKIDLAELKREVPYGQFRIHTDVVPN